MEFKISLLNVLLALSYAALGFYLCKVKKAVADHLPTLSAVLVYLSSPFIVINAFRSITFSKEGLGQMGLFFLVVLVIQLVFMGLLMLLFRKKQGDVRYRLAVLASTMGNAGFFGIPIVQVLFPNNPVVMCYACMTICPMNLIAFTLGIYLMTGKKEAMTPKNAFTNPTMLGLLIALPLFVLEWLPKMPEVVVKGVETMAGISTPLCMIILGIRLATVDLKKLFTRPMVYFACGLKLLVCPLFCFGIVSLFPMFDATFRGAMLMLAGMPCASILLNLAEIHQSDTEFAANCVLLSTLLCCVTIPLLSLLLR